MAPLGCSGKSPARPTIPTSTDPCKVLRLKPPPPLNAVACTELGIPLNDQVCIHWQDVVALTTWIADVEETRVGLEGCPYVAPTDK